MNRETGAAIDRRTFLFAGVAAAMGSTVQEPHLETLTEWLSASREARRLALPSCLDRIRVMDVSIHAWVQVLPQRNTGDGPLSEVPFGVKDVMETRGLSTEYG
jgi:Asp-tRNA(Asn)/Glu-tRNA(Gln) amidotransferase A subunit family amidase